MCCLVTSYLLHFRFYTLSTTASHHTLQILHPTPCALHPPVATLRMSDRKLDIPHFNLPTPPLSAFCALHSRQPPTLDTTTLHTAVPCRLHTALYTLHIIRFARHSLDSPHRLNTSHSHYTANSTPSRPIHSTLTSRFRLQPRPHSAHSKSPHTEKWCKMVQGFKERRPSLKGVGQG